MQKRLPDRTGKGVYIDMIKTKLRRKISGLEQSGKNDESAYYRSIYEQIGDVK